MTSSAGRLALELGWVVETRPLKTVWFFMYFVYVLLSEKDRKLYVGYSGDLRTRFQAHCSGAVPATRERRPLKLIYFEGYTTDVEARQREKYLKGGNGRAQLKVQLYKTLSRLRYLYH